MAPMTSLLERFRIVAAGWLRDLGFRLGRWSRHLEPRRERERKDEAMARKLLSMIAVKSLSDDGLVADLWTLCDDLPVGSRASEVLLEAIERLEHYRALVVLRSES